MNWPRVSGKISWPLPVASMYQYLPPSRFQYFPHVRLHTQQHPSWDAPNMFTGIVLRIMVERPCSHRVHCSFGLIFFHEMNMSRPRASVLGICLRWFEFNSYICYWTIVRFLSLANPMYHMPPTAEEDLRGPTNPAVARPPHIRLRRSQNQMLPKSKANRRLMNVMRGVSDGPAWRRPCCWTHGAPPFAFTTGAPVDCIASHDKHGRASPPPTRSRLKDRRKAVCLPLLCSISRIARLSFRNMESFS